MHGSKIDIVHEITNEVARSYRSREDQKEPPDHIIHRNKTRSYRTWASVEGVVRREKEMMQSDVSAYEVKSNWNVTHVVHMSLLSSPLWRLIKPNVIKLERNMCVENSEEDKYFSQWQRQLASGILNSNDKQVELPSCIHSVGHTLENLVKHVYPSLNLFCPPSFFAEWCLLTLRNTDAQEINESILHSFPGQIYNVTTPSP